MAPLQNGNTIYQMPAGMEADFAVSDERHEPAFSEYDSDLLVSDNQAEGTPITAADLFSSQELYDVAQAAAREQVIKAHEQRLLGDRLNMLRDRRTAIR
jgi:hypothetical protein